MSNCPLVRCAVGTGTTLIGLLTRVTVNVPETCVDEIEVIVAVPSPPACPLSQFDEPRTMVTSPNGEGANVSEMLEGWDGGIWSEPLTGSASVMTRNEVSWPVSVSTLFPRVARLESEPLQATPSIEALIKLVLGVGAGAGTAENATLKTPSVMALVPVAPGRGARLNENVPE